MLPMELRTSCGVSAAMRMRIQQTLCALEEEYQIRILYACESGSRGWGFASRDSDYDVRFIYVHRPEWYLRVEPGRDVIEMPIDDELDVCGWELRKTLGLIKRSNPTLMEWLDSPIVYRNEERATAALRALLPDYFSGLRGRYHYLSMARKNFRGYLQGEEVRLKKYFYVLRPLLAVRWIEAGKGVPPMRFEQLVAGTVDDADLLDEIAQLLHAKCEASEAKYGPRMKKIHEFIQYELDDNLSRCEMVDNVACSDDVLNRLLFQEVNC
jgi:predicted nucleotidyltransferase